MIKKHLNTKHDNGITMVQHDDELIIGSVAILLQVVILEQFGHFQCYLVSFCQGTL